ncbi:MAG: (Fe-S)-binding protein [Acidimicrobiia bacterium]|nr:(Fe-S)-binding protein [Acidimicrobiia bacterium]
MTQQHTVFDSELLGACIACGYCLPTCPTYRLTGDEASSPRGRIILMRGIQDGAIELDDPIALEQSEQCLACRACEPVCPAGVKYGRLIEQWRDAAWKRRPIRLRATAAAVRRSWPVRLGAVVVPHARAHEGADETSLMLGCFERLLFPKVSRAAQRLYPDISVDPRQGCCGALHAHNGDLEIGEEMARQLGEQLPGTIVSTAGGCAAHLASVIGRDRVMEFSEYVAEHPPALPLAPIERRGRVARIAIQDSCHLRNGLGVVDDIRAVVRMIGVLVDLETAGDCCGAAGSYSLLRPNDARRVLEQKREELSHTDVDIIAVVNPGCYRHLRAELAGEPNPVEVAHLAELLAEASVA